MGRGYKPPQQDTVRITGSEKDGVLTSTVTDNHGNKLVMKADIVPSTNGKHHLQHTHYDVFTASGVVCHPKNGDPALERAGKSLNDATGLLSGLSMSLFGSTEVTIPHGTLENICPVPKPGKGR